MNNEQQQIIDEAYKKYESRQINMYIPIWSQEEFINKIKTDTEFSDKWGLKIEERELSVEERIDWMKKYSKVILPMRKFDEEFSLEGFFKPYGVPTKLITIAYNDKIIESYE